MWETFYFLFANNLLWLINDQKGAFLPNLEKKTEQRKIVNKISNERLIEYQAFRSFFLLRNYYISMKRSLQKWQSIKHVRWSFINLLYYKWACRETTLMNGNLFKLMDISSRIQIYLYTEHKSGWLEYQRVEFSYSAKELGVFEEIEVEEDKKYSSLYRKQKRNHNEKKKKNNVKMFTYVCIGF